MITIAVGKLESVYRIETGHMNDGYSGSPRFLTTEAAAEKERCSAAMATIRGAGFETWHLHRWVTTDHLVAIATILTEGQG